MTRRRLTQQEFENEVARASRDLDPLAQVAREQRDARYHLGNIQAELRGKLVVRTPRKRSRWMRPWRQQ